VHFDIVLQNVTEYPVNVADKINIMQPYISLFTCHIMPRGSKHIHYYYYKIHHPKV